MRGSAGPAFGDQGTDLSLDLDQPHKCAPAHSDLPIVLPHPDRSLPIPTYRWSRQFSALAALLSHTGFIAFFVLQTVHPWFAPFIGHFCQSDKPQTGPAR